MTAITAIISRWPDTEDRADVMAAEELSQAARAFAETIASRCRHVPDASRREMAEYIADAIGNALYDVGSELDQRAFIVLCGIQAVAA